MYGNFTGKIPYAKITLLLTKLSKNSPSSIGGEMNCKKENERQWRAERNRYPPLT